VSCINDALRDIHSLDLLATRRTTLSGIDPRAKILSTLAFILVVVSFDRYEVAALLPFFAVPVLLAELGEIPPRLILHKLLIASPFAVMIGLFNPLLDNKPLFELFGYPISGGWASFASIILRYCLTVSMALILIASTGFHQVCVGLERLGVPRVFTVQLLFLYRYVHVLADEAGRMTLARELRAGGGRQGLPFAVYGSLLGHLLLRTLDRAQRIHLAMASRGFSGELRTIRPMNWHLSDSLFLAMGCVCFLLARRFDMAHLLGNLILGKPL
jgi:cobalt/nickel transport system permease protein